MLIKGGSGRRPSSPIPSTALPKPVPSSSARSYSVAVKQAFKDYAKINTPGFDTLAHLGYARGDVGNRTSPIKLPAGASSPFKLPSFSGSSGAGFSGGGDFSSGAPAAPAQLDYYQAALASQYGMDVTTAYQEALANTSYQRAVQDMLNAGLNPASLFAAGRVSGADGVGYATQIGADPVYSVGGGTGSASGKSKGKYVFGKGTYQALQVVGGGLAVAATKRPSAYFAGVSAAKGIMQAINGFFR